MNYLPTVVPSFVGSQPGGSVLGAAACALSGSHVDLDVVGVGAVDTVSSCEHEVGAAAAVADEDGAAGVAAEPPQGALPGELGDVGVLTVHDERHLVGGDPVVVDFAGVRASESASNEAQKSNL